VNGGAMEKAIGRTDYSHRFVGSKRPSLHQTLIVELECESTSLNDGGYRKREESGKSLQPYNPHLKAYVTGRRAAPNRAHKCP
jgi:hypothetical protein